MTDEKKTAQENTNTENETIIRDTSGTANKEVAGENDIEKSGDAAHDAASAHFKHGNPSISPTREELRANADRAAEIAKNLHETIATSTPEGSTFEVMSNDKNKAAQTQDDIARGADPLTAYEGYSAYAVSQPKPEEDRNYYDKPLTYDEYSVSEDKKEYNVNYNLTEVIPGSVAKATNDPNAVMGTDIDEKSFSYNEKKSGSKTIVTTEYTSQGTHTPSSYHINSGQSQVDKYTNKTSSRYVYDKNDRLIEETNHSTSNNVISDQKLNTYKKQDMTKGYCRTTTEIRASRNSPTSFAHVEYTKDGTEKEQLFGNLSPVSESYTHLKGNRATEVTHHKNTRGEWVYEGYITQADGSTPKETLSPKKAEKEFNKLQNDANKHIEDLTGTNGMSEYSRQLGEKKKLLNLNTLWNGHAAAEDKAKAEQISAEVSQKYANIPAAVVALKTNGGR